MCKSLAVTIKDAAFSDMSNLTDIRILKNLYAYTRLYSFTFQMTATLILLDRCLSYSALYNNVIQHKDVCRNCRCYTHTHIYSQPNSIHATNV